MGQPRDIAQAHVTIGIRPLIGAFCSILGLGIMLAIAAAQLLQRVDYLEAALLRQESTARALTGVETRLVTLEERLAALGQRLERIVIRLDRLNERAEGEGLEERRRAPL